MYMQLVTECRTQKVQHRQKARCHDRGRAWPGCPECWPPAFLLIWSTIRQLVAEQKGARRPSQQTRLCPRQLSIRQIPSDSDIANTTKRRCEAHKGAHINANTHLCCFWKHGWIVGAGICCDGPCKKARPISGGEVQIDLDDVQQQLPAASSSLQRKHGRIGRAGQCSIAPLCNASRGVDGERGMQRMKN
eukprot:1154308-Pelagomonas_calceolata.AAC.6